MNILTFEAIRVTDGERVGGKGLSLGLMIQAGLPVPGGFCLCSHVHRQNRGKNLADLPEIKDQILDAYAAMGGGLVAVRSSATSEDGAAASFAGQQETFLGLEGPEALCQAIERCWNSLESERAQAYRRQQGIEDEGVAMAVVVQRLIDAEVAGVLFTKNPVDPEGKTMLVEASYGLGESVVSGRVMPDRFQLEIGNGRIGAEQIATKNEMQTSRGLVKVPLEKQAIPCLNPRQLAELEALGRSVEQFYKGPRDVEWAWANGKYWLLQARPITTADAAEREKVRRSMIDSLKAIADPRGTVWSRFNLCEILPDPTPMTWAIVRRFMSGKGGYGLMFRDLGSDPDPSLDEKGIFDLVCGRPYCNLSREAKLHFRKLPYGHSFKLLKENPQKALYPQAAPFGDATWSFWLLLPLRLPGILWQLSQAGVKQEKLTQEFPRRFREQILPEFIGETNVARQQSLADRSSEELLHGLEFWIQRTLFEFARESLKPTALAALAMARLEQKLAQTPIGPIHAAEAVRNLVMGVHPDVEADLPRGIREVSDGKLDRHSFLERFGHRGSQEMELSRPRWDEDPEAVDRLFSQKYSSSSGFNLTASEPNLERIWKESRLPPGPQKAIRAELDKLQELLGLRETAKHHLMRGYALIRRHLLELDRRYRLNGGIFFLVPDELPRLIQGADLTQIAVDRRRLRMLALSLEVPSVLFSDDLEAIGRPTPPASTDQVIQGTPLSAGSSEAIALVLDAPRMDALPTEPYILVCPSTDPAWVPLFVQAKGLVMETGGVLSHGAIVAREFGLPAVAGLPGITRQIQNGQRIRVDGTNGQVMIVS